MSLIAPRRGTTRASFPWVSVALALAAGLVVRGEISSEVRAGAAPAGYRPGSAQIVREQRAALGVRPSPRAPEAAPLPAPSSIPVTSPAAVVPIGAVPESEPMTVLEEPAHAISRVEPTRPPERAVTAAASPAAE